MAKKRSELKPLRLKTCNFSFGSYHSFKDTVTNFEKDMFRIFALLPYLYIPHYKLL